MLERRLGTIPIRVPRVPDDHVGNTRSRSGKVIFALQVPSDQIASDPYSASVLLDLDVSTHHVATASEASNTGANRSLNRVLHELQVSTYRCPADDVVKDAETSG